MNSYLFMRSLARFFGSVFFPFFRVWGENELKPNRGCIYIARNYGLLTWISALRVFRRPIRFVSADLADDRPWFGIAEACGLEPIKLSGDTDQDFLCLENLFSQKKTVLLMIPKAPDQSILSLVARVKAARHLTSLFMAISGVKEALSKGSLIPKVFPVSVFCGMPHAQPTSEQIPLSELEFLEKAVADIPLNELPSIFFNHSHNC
ncbi:MAG: hypothetical protein KKB51_13575 [Candidatus Riflebacteria bacterium]|nr:hypothetical protein [Candidatus Riflebacteria bacterium]